MGLSRRQRDDLLAAVEADKYWKSRPGVSNEIFVVALSRARIRGQCGMYAKATRVGRVCVVYPTSNLVRRYRVLLIRAEGRNWRARKILTWRAFVSVMRNKELLEFALDEKTPTYINRRTLGRLLKNR